VLRVEVSLTKSFISDISLSTSSINWMMKSTNLCFNMSSVWKLVIRKEMSYPYVAVRTGREVGRGTNLDGLSAEDEEGLGSLGQESGEFVDQDVFYLIGLLDLYADADAVDARFNEDSFVVVSRNGQGVQQGLGGCGGFDLRDVVSLSHLGGEVGERQSGSQRRADALEVGPQ
jgi:hypothetical protein